MYMNPITKALDEIRMTIPPQILQQVFVTQDMHRSCPQTVSMDTRIREEVLERRVLPDVNLIGGTEAFLPLQDPVRTEQVDPYTVIYHIPDEVTQNRAIVQVYSVHFAMLGYHNAGMAMQHMETPMGNATRQVLDSATRTPPAATSYVNMIAHNTVMVRFVYVPYPQAFMRVRLADDEAMSSIRPQAMHEFAYLCVHAVKAYIYNTMMITMDQGYLSGGQQLGMFREVIQGYQDADQMYREALVRWKKISVLNDPEARRRHLRTVLGNVN